MHDRDHAAMDVVRGFQGLRALVIGDAMLDTYLEGDATRLCKEGPVPVLEKTAVIHAPGGAANTAANLRSLGASVVYVGVVGTDPTAEDLRRILRERGVADHWLVGDPGCATLHKTRVIANGQYVVRFDDGDIRRCRLNSTETVLQHLEMQIRHCDLVIVPDYGYGVITDELITRLAELRTHRRVVLAVDSKHPHRFARARATVITPNFLEAWQSVHPDEAPPRRPTPELAGEIGRKLLGQIDSELIVVTLAGDGVVIVNREGETSHVPAHPVPHAGDVGAGDSFTAAMALALASGAGPSQAAQIGIDAAGIAVTEHHTAVVRHRDLLRKVSLEEHAPDQTLKALAANLDAERFAGRTIVFTNGVFDILHAGHVQLLRRAKALGDVLVVGINSDASTRRLKGRTRPINTERDRLALVAALDSVDYAVIFEEDNPAELIRALRPNIHVKGGDYTPETLPEADATREVGARVEILPLVDGRSTTNVIRKIKSLAGSGSSEAGQ
jgi:D-beta-D-heptose 7-phosphate kinase / D-beta-D-heptose 1-phosphate adenosyltransferase